MYFFILPFEAQTRERVYFSINTKLYEEKKFLMVYFPALTTVLESEKIKF